MWSDGTPVTTADVMFWVNMLKAVGATDWGAYTGMPDAFVKSIKVVSPTELQMTTNKAYSHTWFLYNDLSQITPMPAAWDKTASGPSELRDQGRRLRRGLQVPRRPVQGADHLRVLAAVVGRGRPVEAVGVQRRRSCNDGPQPEVLRTGEAHAEPVPGGAVYDRRRGIQRAAVAGRRWPEDRRGLPAVAGRHRQARRIQPAHRRGRTRCRVTRCRRCTPGASTTSW